MDPWRSFLGIVLQCGSNGATFRYRSQRHFSIFWSKRTSMYDLWCTACSLGLMEYGNVRWHKIGLETFLKNLSTTVPSFLNLLKLMWFGVTERARLSKFLLTKFIEFSLGLTPMTSFTLHWRLGMLVIVPFTVIWRCKTIWRADLIVWGVFS